MHRKQSRGVAKSCLPDTETAVPASASGPASDTGANRAGRGRAAQRSSAGPLFLFGLATIFAKIAILPELLVTFLHVNTYILWIVSPPALFGGALFTGGHRQNPEAWKSGRLFLWFFTLDDDFAAV